MPHPKLHRQRMLQWIEERLAEKQSQPTDVEICQRFGFQSTEQARTLLAELADAGQITIKGYGADRSIVLGRVPSSIKPAPRPTASVKRADAVLDQDVARIMAIVGRGRNAPPANIPVAASPAPDVLAVVPPTPPVIDMREEEDSMSLHDTKIGKEVDLAAAPIDWLASEISRRVTELTAERNAAVARAEAAESQLATVRHQVRQLLDATAIQA